MFTHIVSPYTSHRGESDCTTVSFSSLSLAQITGMQLLLISQNVSRDLNAAKEASQIEVASLAKSKADRLPESKMIRDGLSAEFFTEQTM